MKSKLYKMIGILMVLTMLLAACGTTPPEAEEAPVTEEETAPEAEEVEEVEEAEPVEEPEEKEPVTIKWSGWMLNEWGEETYDFILDSFKEKYPYITVEVVDMPYNDVLSKYQAAAGGGEVYDVFATEYTWNVPLYAAGYLENLDPWFEADPEFSDALAREVYDMKSAGGETTGVCMYLITFGLMYNVNMFEELGLTPPTSWEEFVAVSEEIRTNHPDIYPIAMGWGGHQAISSRTIHQMAVQYGANVVNDDGTAGFEHPGWKRAFELWKEYYDSGLAVPNALGLDTMIPREMYANEQVAMLWEGPFAAGVARLANPDMVSAYTLPFKTETGTGGYQWTCSGTSISQKSEHKEEALLFLKHLMSDEVADRMLEVNKLAWATDYAFAKLADSDDQVLNKLPLMAANDPDSNYSMQPIPNATQLAEFFKATAQQVMSGELSIDEALVILDEEYQKNIDAGF